VGVRQHFQMGRVRAVETRRYVLRSVNDGIAAVITPTGEVRQSFAGPGSGVLRARFAFRGGLTPYVRWGDWPVLALAALLAAGAISAGRRVRID
jgi:apolipoprotein N-acyltransferase